jgi:hypothetical protein
MYRSAFDGFSLLGKKKKQPFSRIQFGALEKDENIEKQSDFGMFSYYSCFS